MNDKDVTDIENGDETDPVPAGQLSLPTWSELEWFEVWLKLAHPAPDRPDSETAAR